MNFCTMGLASGIVLFVVSMAVLLPASTAREEEVEDALDSHSKASQQTAAAAAHRALLLSGLRYYNGGLDDDLNQLEDGSSYERLARGGGQSQRWRLYDPSYMAKRYMRFGKRSYGDEEFIPADENEAEKRYMRFGKRYMRFGRMVNTRGEY